MSTILDHLLRHADAAPDRLALTFLRHNGAPATLTYAGLVGKAAGIARHLQESVPVESRALLLFPPGLEFVEAFIGCLAAGVIATPSSMPRRNQNHSRVRSIIETCRPAVILTTTESVAFITDNLAAERGEIPIVATDSIAPAGDWPFQIPDAQRVSFLQYTSGSTGAARGVAITHANLVHNLIEIQRQLGSTSDDVHFSWLPMFHDMGLISSILGPLFNGLPSISMAPAEFARQPLRWLRAVMDHRCTVTGGPTSALEHCCQTITESDAEALDLSTLRVIYVGAEPVLKRTLDRFAAKFAPGRLRSNVFLPCYGLAESTLLVSGGPHGTGARALHSVVSCGEIARDTKVAIVDPQGNELSAPEQIGEVWVSSPSVGKGYWQDNDATVETFQARLPGRSESFLRTGDLGFVHNGELFITGRIKDLLIVAGRNIYPQDIEAAVMDELGLAVNSCIAFPLKHDEREYLGVAIEATRADLRKAQSADRKDLDDMVARLQRRLTRDHDVAVSGFMLIRPGRFPRTTSGKVQRHAFRQPTPPADVVFAWSARHQVD